MEKLNLNSICSELSNLIHKRNFKSLYEKFNLNESVFCKVNTEGYTLLHLAAKTPNAEELISFLIKKGFDIDVLDEYGRTPIFQAVNDNRIENVKKLLTYSPNLSIVDKENDLMFNIACAANSLECVKLLLDYGVDIDSKKIGISPLRDAIYHEASDELIDTLLNRGANINGVGFSVPLLAAIALGDLEIVKYLLQKGADLSKVSKNGEDAITFCKRIQKTEILKYLLSLNK